MMNNTSSAATELRTFAFTLSCVLGFLGGFVLWRKGETGFLFWVIGMAFLLMGFLRPKILGPIHKGWMGMSFLMGFFMTHLILALIYYLVFTPMGLVMKALSRDPLRLNHDQSAKSYWIRRPRGEFLSERYEKMF